MFVLLKLSKMHGAGRVNKGHLEMVNAYYYKWPELAILSF